MPTPIFLERRFPLGLTESIPSIRDLYHRSKDAHWAPQIDIDWDGSDFDRYPASVREAAALSWSRCAWVEYTKLAETPSLLVRFCVEPGREADPKLYLTVRNTEEAWHIECCHQMAGRLHRYVEQPEDESFASFLNQEFFRDAMNAHNDLDAYVVARCVIADGLEHTLWSGFADNARDNTARSVLEHCVNDKARHAEFGWLYVAQRHDNWTDEQRETISQYASDYIRRVELGGYHCAWLADSAQTGSLVAADEVCAEAGLGALVVETEKRLLGEFLDQACTKLRVLGIDIDPPTLD
jgi:hypothetical protein